MQTPRRVGRTALVLAFGIVGACAVWAGPGNESGSQTPTSLHLVTMETLALAQSRIVISDSKGQPVQLPVILQGTHYEMALPAAGPGPSESRAVSCYELKSADPARSYSWSTWSYIPLAHFRLLSYGQGRNYLAWTTIGRVVFTDVTAPADRSQELARFLDKTFVMPDLVSVPVVAVAGAVNFAGQDALNFDIAVQSIGQDEAGQWVVKVARTGSPKIFTLVSDPSTRSGWRLAE